jgi:nitroreductase
MQPIFQTIHDRYSVRTYDPRPIEEEKLSVLRAFMADNFVGPFGNTLPEDSEKELKKFVSYGNVKGARSFIAGFVKRGPYALEDFGYCMEKNVLKATELGLGTVWLGGSLRRIAFSEALFAGENDFIPAITPLGYASDKRALMDKVVRSMSRGTSRKDFESLFFMGSSSSPLVSMISLTPASAGKYADALEAVRLAPSASNQQPWRIIKETAANVFHFYLKETPGYTVAGDIRIQNNDIGIAMCHFGLTTHEAGLSGGWRVKDPGIDAVDWVYVVSWVE